MEKRDFVSPKEQWSKVCPHQHHDKSEMVNINLKCVLVFSLVPGHLSIQVHTPVSQAATQHLTRTGSRNIAPEPATLKISQISTPGWRERRRKCEEKKIVPCKSVYDSWRGTFVFTRGFMRTRIFCCWGEAGATWHAITMIFYFYHILLLMETSVTGKENYKEGETLSRT